MIDYIEGKYAIERKRLQLLHYPNRIVEGRFSKDLPNGSAHIYLRKEYLKKLGFFDAPVKVVYGDRFVVIKRAEKDFKVNTKGKAFKGKVHTKRIHLTHKKGTALLHLSKYHMHRFGWVSWHPPVLDIYYDFENKKILICENLLSTNLREHYDPTLSISKYFKSRNKNKNKK